MIPDDAIEAACENIKRATELWLHPLTGGDAHTIATAAIEAAVPHLMAQAWQEGYIAGRNGEYDDANPPQEGRQVIPDEAVEAAARGLADRNRRPKEWQFYLSEARSALEAAAPHILEANEDCCCGTCGL